MSFRRFRRAVALAFALELCVLRYWIARLRGPLTLERRALWLQSAARIILTSAGIQSTVEGQPPSHGLVVSNHLSYLDIVILSAAMPCFFVSKVEVDGWPFFGKAARTGGTIFLDRSSLDSANQVAGQIAERLSLPIPVLLFPEGTSTDGHEVLRFHSRLIDPATEARAPITRSATSLTTASKSANFAGTATSPSSTICGRCWAWQALRPRSASAGRTSTRTAALPPIGPTTKSLRCARKALWQCTRSVTGRRCSI
jgi:1-acyl-sn-glycerol-3-phosphate acyltransferase